MPVDDDAFATGEPFGDHSNALRGAVDLNRLNLGDPVLDDENEIAALAALHRDRRHHYRISLRMMSLVATRVPGHKLSFSLFMMPRTVTMPVVISTVFSTIATLPFSER